MKISGYIAEVMPSLDIWNWFIFWLDIRCHQQFKGPFIATQLNWTQLNSTQVLRPDDTTQLNSTQLDVELSWVVSL